MMKFATLRTMVLLTLGWAGLCYGASFALHPPGMRKLLERPTTENTRTTPHVALFMNHLCCSGCVDDTTKALAQIPWASNPKISSAVDAPDKKTGDPTSINLDSRNRLDFDVADPNQIDFVALVKVLRETGLVADKIELSGVDHFRIEAEFKHVCCEHCAGSLDAGIGNANMLKATGQLNWIDSVVVSKQKKTVTVHARYSVAADVLELLTALNHLGFEPSTLKVLVGAET